jgi:hypothetical protein
MKGYNMNTRRRLLKRVMENTYIEGRVWTTDVVTGVLIPMEKDQIDLCIKSAIRDNSLTPAPFYYNADSGSYIQIMYHCNRDKQHRTEMEQLSFRMKENMDRITKYDELNNKYF